MRTGAWASRQESRVELYGATPPGVLVGADDGPLGGKDVGGLLLHDGSWSGTEVQDHECQGI